MEGIQAAHEIRGELPQIGIVVLSQHADASYAQALFRGGTGGLAYLLKERVGDRDELVRALGLREIPHRYKSGSAAAIDLGQT